MGADTMCNLPIAAAAAVTCAKLHIRKNGSFGRKRRVGRPIVAATLLFSLVGAPATAQEMNDLAALNGQVVQLHRIRNYVEAIPLAQRALALAERLRGPDHPDVGTALNNLAALTLRTPPEDASAIGGQQ